MNPQTVNRPALLVCLVVAVAFQAGKGFAQLADGFDISLPHGHTASVTGAAFLDERLVATCAMDATIIIWDFDAGCPVRRIFAPDECFAMQPSQDGRTLTILCGNGRRGFVRAELDPYSGEISSSPAETRRTENTPSPDLVRALSLKSDASFTLQNGQRVLVGYDDGRIEIWGLTDGAPSLLQKLAPQIAKPNAVATAQNIVATWSYLGDSHDLRFWDVEKLNCQPAETGSSTSIVSGVFADGGTYFVSSEDSRFGWDWNLVVRETATGRIVSQTSTPKNKVATLSVTPGSGHIVQTHYGLAGPGIYVWQLVGGKLKLQRRLETVTSNCAVYDAGRDRIYANPFVIEGESIANVYDAAQGRLIGTLGNQVPEIFGSVVGMKLSNDGNSLLTMTFHRSTGYCAITDLVRPRSRVFDFTGIHSAFLRRQGQQLLLGGTEGNTYLQLTDRDSGRKLDFWSADQGGEFREHRVAAAGWSMKKDTVALSTDESSVYVVDRSGAVQILEITAGNKFRPTARLLPLTDGDWAIVANEGHYAASPGAATKLAFTKRQKAYPFEQFDLQYNRPDQVLAALGGDEELVRSLGKAHGERLLKYRAADQKFDIQKTEEIEVAILNRSSFAGIVRSAQSELAIQVGRPNRSACRLSLLVNGVEQADVAVPAGMVALNIPVTLASGTNRIEVFAVDQKGRRSLPETLRVQCRPSVARNPDLYLLAVGVSDYAVDELDLEVAAKDATDVIEYFTRQQGVAYQTVHSRLLVNAEASRENIVAESKFLNQASPQDTVIVFFAGHGMLEATTLDYYFGTPDIDPEDVGSRGLSYAQIEQMFSSCQSTNRLLLMDTCFAGEVERFDVAANDDNGRQLANGVTARSFALTQAPARRADSKADLRRQYFTDLRRSTGINVITASGGMEFVFALEEDTIGNGLFTHCFLKALDSGDGDFDGNGRVEIGELGKYLNESLAELSDGAQRPSFREVNRYSDFAVAQCRAFPKFDAASFIETMLEHTIANGSEAQYASLFRDPCDYFDSTKSRSAIEAGERSYHQRFDDRHVQLIGEPRVTRISDSSHSVRYPIHIILHNSQENSQVYAPVFQLETLIEQELELTVEFEEDRWLISKIEVLSSGRKPNPMFSEAQ